MKNWVKSFGGGGIHSSLLLYGHQGVLNNKNASGHSSGHSSGFYSRSDRGCFAAFSPLPSRRSSRPFSAALSLPHGHIRLLGQRKVFDRRLSLGAMLEGVLLEKVLPGRVEQKRVSDEFFTSCAELFDIVTSEGRHAHTAQTFKACFEHADCIGVLESHEDRSKQIFFELLKQLPEGSCVLFESVNSGTPTGKALERFTRLQCAGADDAALPMGLVYSGWDDLDLIHEGLEKKAAFRALCRSKGVRFDQDTRGNVRWPVSVKQAFNAYRNVIIEARDRHREQVLTARLEQLSDHDGVDGEKREKKEKGIKRKIVWLAGLDHGYEPMQCPSSRYSGRHCMMLVPKGVSPAATYIPI